MSKFKVGDEVTIIEEPETLCTINKIVEGGYTLKYPSGTAGGCTWSDRELKLVTPKNIDWERELK